MLTVRKVVDGDFSRILEIYGHARKFMAENGNAAQWGTTHPSEAILREDIKKGQLYAVCEDAVIHGVFAFLLEPDPTYFFIDGSWRSQQPYGTIHRVAADGSGGVFDACMKYSKNRCNHLRIDTHENNKIMQYLILRAGFSRRGIIYLEDGASRIAYDWIREV